MVTRVLHVMAGLDRGGVETWLLHVLRHIDRDRLRMDFLVHLTRPCAYDADVRKLGSKILPCPNPWRLFTYRRNFLRILQEHGPYDVVHSHVHHFSGYPLLLAHRAGIPIRIAHSHLDDTLAFPVGPGILRGAYFRSMRRWIDRHATTGLAASRQAAAALFGPDWERNGRWHVHHYTLDCEPFHTPVDPAVVRSELGIPADAFVLGHVGRFHEQKNHSFFVDVAVEVAKREPRAYFLLVGDGPLRPAIARKVAQAGLAGKFVFAGVRPDVPRLMMGAMDVFLLPSLYEGFGIVGLEAQAAGVPVVLADTVPPEVDIVQDLTHRLSLSQPSSEWARAVLAQRTKTPETFRRGALSILDGSPFNIKRNASHLEAVYGY